MNRYVLMKICMCVYLHFYIYIQDHLKILATQAAIKVEGNIMAPCHVFRIIVATQDRSSAC